MPVEVRRAVPSDAAAIAAVHVRTWQVAYRGLMPDELLDRLSVAERETFWRDALTRRQGPGAVLVAAQDGAVLGFCAVATPSRDDDAGDGVAEIGAIYVESGVWRAGVGRALMQTALDDLRAEGWRAVTLWVLAENRQAREFYAQFGFGPDGAETAHEPSGQTEVRLRASLTA
jgi:ribosomal protein S18 acetylase RimI-like enzyme